MFDYELSLITKTSSKNGLSDPIYIETKTDILCDIKSVSRSEHYAAAAHGIPPEIVFVVNIYEYEGQSEVEFEGTRYRVTRTYKPKKFRGLEDFETLELVCEGAVNHGST